MAVRAYWYQGNIRNFGDEITPILVKEFFATNATQQNLTEISTEAQNPILFGVGSIAEHVTKPNQAIIWGSGIIQRNSRLISPMKIIAVRGPLTRAAYISQGIDCPEIYGDPAILLPLIKEFQSTPLASHRLGIIPHYVDIKLASSIVTSNDEIKIIDVRRSVADVVADIQSCELIISSSLHGLIVANSFNIPAKWVKFSNNLFGDDVKFYDYYSSCGIHVEPTWISRSEDIKAILKDKCFTLANTSDLAFELIKNTPFDHIIEILTKNETT